MRWLGCCVRANEIATDYANRRMAFGKPLIDHEGVGFMLAAFQMKALQRLEFSKLTITAGRVNKPLLIL
jgi:alkylation response protein AidB-like acyl-CoA dehydrogenase